MNRSYVLSCLLPALLLLGISGTLVATGSILKKSSEHVPQGKEAFVEKLKNNEHTPERLRQFAMSSISTDETEQKMHGSLAELLFALAAGVVMVAGWVTYSGYQAQKA